MGMREELEILRDFGRDMRGMCKDWAPHKTRRTNRLGQISDLVLSEVRRRIRIGVGWTVHVGSTPCEVDRDPATPVLVDGSPPAWQSAC